MDKPLLRLKKYIDLLKNCFSKGGLEGEKEEEKLKPKSSERGKEAGGSA